MPPTYRKRKHAKVSDDESEEHDKSSSKAVYLDLPPPCQNQQLSLQLQQTFKDQIEAKEEDRREFIQ
jgi:hypothetical protein